MTRKAKIGWVVGGIALAAAAICFFPEGDEGELRLSYVGPSQTNSEMMIFLITNTSAKPFVYFVQYEHAHRTTVIGPMREIRGQTNEMTFVPQLSVKLWQLSIGYQRPSDQSVIGRLRRKAQGFAEKRHWDWLDDRLRDHRSWKLTFGPYMLGNKPLPEGQKWDEVELVPTVEAQK